MLRRASGVGVAGALLVSVLGCGGGSASAPPPATEAAAAADDEASAGVLEHHRYHHHGGVPLFIALSLDTLGLSADERVAVEKIQADLRVKMAPARAAEQNLIAALAEGVAAAKFDAAKVDGAIAQVTTAASAIHDASADALNQLHAALTPPQRAALADKIEAHWAVWQKANAEEPSAAAPGSDESGPLAALAADLDLKPDQVDRIRAGLAAGTSAAQRFDPQEIAAHVRAVSEAFRSEKFDAKALAAASAVNARLAGWGAARLARLAEVVSPVLAPDQREKFVQSLREHAAHDPGAPGKP